MLTVLLTIHTLIVVALIGIILMQKSDGAGGLGMSGGGGGGGGLMSGRGATSALTKITIALAVAFFVSSLVISLYRQPTNGQQIDDDGKIDSQELIDGVETTTGTSLGDAFDSFDPTAVTGDEADESDAEGDAAATPEEADETEGDTAEETETPGDEPADENATDEPTENDEETP